VVRGHGLVVKLIALSGTPDQRWLEYIAAHYSAQDITLHVAQNVIPNESSFEGIGR
jgi:hypothetical protein